MKRCWIIALLATSLLLTPSAFAWRHGIAIGYGYGKEVGVSYHNQGVFINGILYRFNKIDKFLILTINASAGFWTASTTTNRKLNVVSIEPNLRAYFVNPEKHAIRPYIQLSFGPAYLSNKVFGTQKQGLHFAFQTTLGGGVEIGNAKHAVDLSLMFIHYCNAGIAKPNHGSDIPFVFTVGYLF